MRSQEFIREYKEKINQAVMQPGFKFSQEINGVVYKVINKIGMPEMLALDKQGQVIGAATFWKHPTQDGLESLSTHVDQAWQGKGIAANMYAVMRMLGVSISPSANRTNMGKAMWAKWSRQGDAKHLKNLNPRIKEQTVTEGLSHPVICVDVQPEYNGGPWPPANAKFVQIMNFVQKQTGPVLFFVNAEDQGMSGDSIQQIQQFWDDTLGTEGEEGEDENGDYYYNEPESPVDWRRFEIVDKGYGYLRSWMDHGIEPSTIIATIREMYNQKVSDTRDLEFPAFNRRTTTQSLIQGAIEEMEDDPMTVGWASVSQLKRFSGAYLVGGGREECLREVELLMNAFNIKYKRIDSLVY
jgi:hypothetical protein